MSGSSNCPCETFSNPALIVNPPGRDRIVYRAGDYSSFRRALLNSLPGEVELTNWRPTASNDLALQMIEWWAYLADILTFYNQEIANEDYLRTARPDESVNRIIRILGYRPRPAIGALATLAALTSAKKPFTLPAAFAVQSKPGPGQQPQVFELTADTIVQPFDHVSADPLPVAETLGADGSVLLKGVVGSIKTGDQLLMVSNTWNGTDANYSVRTVASIQSEPSPCGDKNTRVRFASPLGLPANANAANYRLLRSTQSTRLWQYNGADSALSISGGTGVIDLESVVRQIQPGDIILFEATRNEDVAVLARSLSFLPPADVFSQQQVKQLASVTAYSELIWYANSPTDPPTTPPADTNTPGIAILHSELTFRPAFSVDVDRKTLVIRYGWSDVGQVIPTPSRTFSVSSPELLATDPPAFLTGATTILLEDTDGDGEFATGLAGTDLARLALSDLSNPAQVLSAPVNVLYNLLSMSRGKTVLNEILGSGDSSAASQEFVLKKSSLTYLLSSDSSSGGNYKSTLNVRVDGIEWKEVPSFFGQTPGAKIFVTFEDEQNQTHVQFGDGVNGARLPSGTSNVIATYRFGSGADSPASGKLTTILTPQPGLTAVRNPVAASGGSDPDPASQIRTYAPRSVLTFGRAVSGDDYEAIAASTPGVARARAYWSFDPLQQRTAVTVYVGDDNGAVAAALTALRGDADPNRPVSVKLANVIPVRISLTLIVDAAFVAADVVAAVTTAFLDPQNGLFGQARIRIGDVIYASQIYEACLAVPGTIAVHALDVITGTSLVLHFSHLTSFAIQAPYRIDPGEGAYFSLNQGALSISPEVIRDAG
jgi:hypothetical protein